MKLTQCSIESESSNVRDSRIFRSPSSKYVEVFQANLKVSVIRTAKDQLSWANQLNANICFAGLNGREVAVPVPWGEIRGREWGSEDGVPWIGNTTNTPSTF